ncbi:trehalose-phosphatase [Psychromicrobium sp. YIM B11713]|uniref:trehalose-phosphatase n=1 Tax=Psychromicrobium sp. YIM B11713 TaxID=3145233 RepID=UPI00374F3F1F
MLSTDLQNALKQLARTPRLLVAMDFDGTMSPLVPRAEDARALPANAEAFAALAELPDTVTALISGRALASLRQSASPPEHTLLIGSHGAESWFGPGASPLALTPEQEDLVRQTTEILRGVSGNYPGVTVELKPAGAVLHTRQSAEETAEAAVTAAIEALAALPIQLHEGKRVLEAAVLKVDKGQGLELLRKRTGATAILFAGDDTTDENGFRALLADDVGVKVGDGETAAAFRISSVTETAELLGTLLSFRRNHTQPHRV